MVRYFIIANTDFNKWIDENDFDIAIPLRRKAKVNNALVIQKNRNKNTIDFFKGNQSDITKDLEKEMLTASKLQKYERASEIRDSIQSLNFIIREEIKVGSQDSNYDFILVNKDKYLSIFISFIRYSL